MRFAGPWVALILYLIPACSSGSGSSPELQLVGTDLEQSGTRTINSPLTFHFDRPIDLDSVSLSSLSIEPIPSLTAGAPVASPVQGDFHLLAEGRTLVFQPLCPDATAGDWGLSPGNEIEGVSYQVTLPSSDRGGLLGEDGSRLLQSYSFSFTTPTAPLPVLSDPLPGKPPAVANRNELPEVLDLNLFSHPLGQIEIRINQPVLRETVKDDAIQLRFEHPELATILLPVETVLRKNCTAEGGAIFSLIPRGILPEGTELAFYLSQEVSGLGTGDTNTEDLLFHRATVGQADAPLQQDALLETFDSTDLLDPNPAVLLPLAPWGEGKLEAAPIYPGTNSDAVIEIGPGTTNGEVVGFNTDGATLKDVQGNPLFFADGIIDCRKFILKNPKGKNSRLQGFGPNPLIIRATESILIAGGSSINVGGSRAPNVFGIRTANTPGLPGRGNCGGGDGGTGSPEILHSSAKGEDGKGPGQIPSGGGQGGHGAFGPILSDMVVRPAGGGGGNWGIQEINPAGEYTTFCWGLSRDIEDDGTGCMNNNPGTNQCLGGLPNNSNGENGSNGAQCGNSSPICVLSEAECGSADPDDCRICQQDASTKKCHAQGGSQGNPVFQDGDPQNDFWGRKPIINENGQLEIIEGELTGPVAGQGGGGGGDGIVWASFPSKPPRFPRSDRKGAGGGGGGGLLHLQSLGEIDIRGALFSNGGWGGRGEETGINRVGGGGGGGGSGGMIVIEAPRVFLGNGSNVAAKGGNRSMAGGTLPGFPAGAGKDKCRWNQTSSKGGAGGKGCIVIKTSFDPTEVVTVAGVTQPAIKEGALEFRRLPDGNPLYAKNERQLTPANDLPGIPPWARFRFDPRPHIVLPTFGRSSAAMSRWVYLGWPPRPQELGFASEEAILLAGSAEQARIPRDFTVELESAELANLIGSAPGILHGDAFFSHPGSLARIIRMATREGNRVYLEMDPADPALESVGSWEIRRRNSTLLTNGVPQDFLPPSAEVKILFQSAASLSPGSPLPDPTQMSLFTADPSSLPLPGHQLLRFQVIFHSQEEGEPLHPLLPLPGLDHLKLQLPF